MAPVGEGYMAKDVIVLGEVAAKGAAMKNHFVKVNYCRSQISNRSG